MPAKVQIQMLANHGDHRGFSFSIPEEAFPFEGAGAVMVSVEPGASHAVRNDGKEPFVLVAASSEAYDPQETVARKVI